MVIFINEDGVELSDDELDEEGFDRDNVGGIFIEYVRNLL